MTIKNGDMPAMPVTDDTGMPFNCVPAELSTIGITKREMMAMHMMASIINAATINGTATESGDAKPIAMASVFAADALLAELERTK